VYAVIQTGGKQYRVAEGERLAVERVSSDGDLSFTPILLVDGETVLSAPGELSSATVSARVVGEEKGPKIRGFTYKPKSNNRRRYGHRQDLSVIEILDITPASAKQ